MVSPVIAILVPIIASAIFGDALAKTFDYPNVLTDIEENGDNYLDNDSNIQPWHDLYRNFIKYDENINEFVSNNDINKVYSNKIDTKHANQNKNEEFDNNIVENNLKSKIEPKYKKYVTKTGTTNKEDKIRTYDKKLEKFRESIKKSGSKKKIQAQTNGENTNRRVKRDGEEDSVMSCKVWDEKDGTRYIAPPLSPDGKTYANNINCSLQINATSDDMIIELTFVDMFSIEPHPDCAYDYLEIRDGLFGYSKLIGKVCGTAFPPHMRTTGPNMWLKFHSDDAIEQQGFKIKVTFKKGASQRIPEACFMRKRAEYGAVGTMVIEPDCKAGNANQVLDVLWTIETAEGTQIYLNFTSFQLANPNLCGENIVEVFGAVLEENARLAFFCGTKSQSVMTKGKNANKMHVRLFASREARTGVQFAANFSAFRTLDASKNEACAAGEFNCEDNTCVRRALLCDGTAHCRLHTDEDERCDSVTQSVLAEKEVLIICIIFSLILAGMAAIFLFKFGWKVYQDQKIIKENLKQSCENRLVDLGSRLTLDPKFLTDNGSKVSRSDSPTSNQDTLLDLNDPWTRQVDSFPTLHEDIRIERAARKKQNDGGEPSMRSWMGDRDTERIKELRDEEKLSRKDLRDSEGVSTIEMRNTEDYDDKEMRDMKRLKRKEMRDIEILKRKDIEDKERKRKAMRNIQEYSREESKDVDGHSGENMRHSKKERSDTEGPSRKEMTIDKLWKEREDTEESSRKVMRDASVVTTDMKESSCQTRDSLFLTDPSPSSGGSRKGSGSRLMSPLSTRGITATPPRSGSSHVTIELVKQDSNYNRTPESRPISTETTKSAPDVIIVSPT